MKKRIIGILLAAIMLIGIIPFGAITAFAEGNAKPGLTIGNVNLLTADLNSVDAATVNFGTNANGSSAVFRVIGDETSGVKAPEGCLTLISEGLVAPGQSFNDDEYTGEYIGSSLQETVNGSVALDDAESASVKPRTLLGGKIYSADCDGVAGSDVENAIFWAPTTADANAMNEELRKAVMPWWLCSPGYQYEGASFVHEAANVYEDGLVNYWGADVREYLYGVRSAFYLDLSSVLFVSSADGGKALATVGGMAIPFVVTESGALKLTVIDDSRNFAVTGCEWASADRVKITYTGAKTGAYEYISYYVLDANGAVKKYAKIVASTTANGSATFERPELAEGETLYVINEHANIDGKTDYASAPVTLEMPCQHVSELGKCEDNGDGTHVQTCDVCGEKFGAEAHSFTSGIYRDNGDGTHSQRCTRCGAYGVAVAHDFSSALISHNNGDGTHSTQCVCGKTANAKILHEFRSGLYRYNADGSYSQKCLVCDEYTDASGEDWSYVSYYEYKPSKGVYDILNTVNYTVVSADTTAWNGGVYVVKTNVTINSRVQVSGDVKLVLVNGASLTVKGGIGVPSDATFAVCAMSMDPSEMGTLTVCDVEAYNAGIGGDYATVGGTVTIHGGILDVTGGGSAAGIGSGASETIEEYETIVVTEASCYDITVYGGVITAQGGRNSAGIGGGLSASCDDINIYGGCIKSSGGAYSPNPLGLGRDGIRIGTITYPAGQTPTYYDNIVYIGCIPQFGKYATCVESGFKDAYFNLKDELYYSAMVMSPATLIGDAAALAVWTTEGAGFLPATGHNFESYNINGHNHRCTSCGEIEVHTDADGNGYCDGCNSAIYYYFNPLTEQIEMTTVDYYCISYDGTTELNVFEGENIGWYLVDHDVTVNGRINVTGDVNLVLANGVKLTVSDGISVIAPNSLTIYSSTQDENKMATVTIPNTDNKAGIGGCVSDFNGPATSNGTLTIYGGRYSIKSSYVGIGGGRNGTTKEDYLTEYYPVPASECNPITIYGGVYDFSGTGLGIGCGTLLASVGDITIHSGTFYDHRAETEYPYIGSAEYSACGNIIINGGVFHDARGGGWSAAIGTYERHKSTCGTITINDGTFYNITGGGYSAAIGAGDCCGCGDITINAGNFYNIKGGYPGGAAIGSGVNGGCSHITINGGFFTAESGGIHGFDAPAIGGVCDKVTINGGYIKANGNTITGIGATYSADNVVYGKGVCHYESGAMTYVGIEPIKGKAAGCDYPGYREAYRNCTENLYYTEFTLDSNACIGDADAYAAWKAEGGAGYLPATGEKHRDWVSVNADVHKCGHCEVTASHADTNDDGKCDGCGINKYYELDSQTGEWKEVFLHKVTALTASTTTLSGGIYIVTGTVTVPDRIQVSGNVGIVLANGAELIANGGIEVGQNSTLTFYSQALDIKKYGKLTAIVAASGNAAIGSSNGGNLVINGGIFDVLGAANAAGIGSGDNGTCGTITINAGIIDTTGGSSAAGIGSGGNGICGAITINNGYIIAKGGINGPGIGCVGTGVCDTVTINGGIITAYADETALEGIGAGVGDTNVNVVYADGVYHETKNHITRVNYICCDGLAPNCTEPGYREAFKVPNEEVYYFALPFCEAYLIGDGEAYEEWKTSGDGRIAPNGHTFTCVDGTTHACEVCGTVGQHVQDEETGRCADCNITMYYDYNEGTQSFELKAVPVNAEVLSGTISADKYYNGEWYVIRGDVNVDRMITFLVKEKEQNTHIILENGANFKANKGIRVCNETIFCATTLDNDKMGRIEIPGADASYAGIGCSWIGENDPDIVINGGRYYVYGSPWNAAIGGAYEIPAADITIHGGYFERIGGGNYAAAIGSGVQTGCGDITITGGYFDIVNGSWPTAYEGDNGKAGAAAIGSGWSGSCGEINISGGTLRAINARAYGAAIGCGSEGATCAGINISGGYFIDIIGGPNAAAIGNGWNSGEVNVNITGGIMHLLGGGTEWLQHTNTPALRATNVNVADGMQMLDYADGLPGIVVNEEEYKNRPYLVVCPGDMISTSSCTKAGHKEYYADTSGILYYRYDYPTKQTLSGDREQWIAWKEAGYTEFSWKLDEDIKFYRDEEHFNLIGNYYDLVAWLNDDSENGGFIPAAGHKFNVVFEDGHQCSVCKIIEEHIDEDTNGFCDTCGTLLGSEHIVKSLGAQINTATSSLRLGATYNGKLLEKSEREAVKDMGTIFYPSHLLGEETLDLDNSKAVRMSANAIIEFVEDQAFADYETFTFYVTIVGIPENGWNTKIAFRPFIILGNGTIEYGEVMERCYNDVVVAKLK